MQIQQLGPYRIGKRLGQGGMGAVYEAVDTVTGETAAIKVLAPQLATDEGFRIRFQAEIESLKKLRHPNIVRLFGYGEEQGSIFYAMELVRGTSLEDELRAGRRFNWREVTDLAIKLCRALKHAHDAGVIHRDIKPANLLLSETGEIKLSDFGIARLFGNTRMTSDGGVLGTAEYMAPEQADGRVVTDRCDQYSLGSVMYALLSGRPPFRAGSLVEMLQLQRFAEPEPVRRYASDTPAELDQIIRQLLEKDPQRRFVNALILGRSLESMQRGLSLPARPDRDDFILTGERQVTPGRAIDPLSPTIAPTKEDLTTPTPVPLGVTDPIHTQTAVHSEAPASARVARPAPPEPGAARFIKVEEPAAEAPWYHEVWSTVTAWQTLAIVAALAAIGGLVWQAVKPPSAEQLYAEIEKTIDPAAPNSLLVAQPLLQNFLDRFPDDARVDAVGQQLQDAKELREHKQLELKNRQLNRTSIGRSPVERAYREALFYKIPDPDTALARFQALLDLYGHDPGADDNEWVRLARAEVARLGNQLAEDHRQDLATIEAQLASAEAQRTSDLAASEKTWHAIVTLYGDKPWAAQVVAQARQALAGTTTP
ncbi:MAG TPA: serine/threonine-protein kinase [Pirellulales bacterium]|jgi:serine/threonine-protein kinase|nr:serine/threonine-protein kinase [Pirellulales bacterium]